MRQLTRVSFLFALLLGSLYCVAQQPESYGIGGTVVNELNGEPLVNCTLDLTAVPRDRMHPASSTDSFTQDTLTDEQGHFSFEQVPRGMYQLTAKKRGFPSQVFEEHDGYSTSIVTGPDLDTEGLVFRLMPSSVIFGSVIDEGNEPVRNALVHLYRDKSRDGSTQGWQSMTVIPTDDRGRFEFADLGPGKYYLSVSARPWYAQNIVQPQSAQAAQEDPDLDVTYATTFYPGVVDPAAAEPIALKSGEQAQTDISLSPVPALHLQILTNSNASRQVYNIQQKLPDGTTSPAIATFLQVSPGIMQISGLSPGTYDIDISGAGPGLRGSGGGEFQREINLTASTTVDSRSQLVADEVEVKGKVLLPSGISRQLNALVKFQAIKSLNRGSGDLSKTKVAQDGTFQISLPAGEYRILTENLGAASIGQITSQGGKASGRTITLSPGQQTVSVVIQMTNGFASLQGFAQHGDKAASAVAVVLVPDNFREVSDSLRRDQSNSDGSFDLEQIIPGHYQLVAVERGWEVDWTNPEMVQQYLAHGVPVELKPGDSLQRNISVQPR